MTPAPAALGFVAKDLPRTLAFYRGLGLDIPAEADQSPHVEVVIAAGFKLMWDPISTIEGTPYSDNIRVTGAFSGTTAAGRYEETFNVDLGFIVVSCTAPNVTWNASLVP